jgi:hypothetical protein
MLLTYRSQPATGWWGYYIVKYEQHGEDRAKYGDKLINRLAEKLDFKGFNPRRLREYRQFYLVYQSLSFEIGKYISNNHIGASLSGEKSIWRSTSAKLQLTDNQANEKYLMEAGHIEVPSREKEIVSIRLTQNSVRIILYRLEQSSADYEPMQNRRTATVLHALCWSQTVGLDTPPLAPPRHGRGRATALLCADFFDEITITVR